jgi:serine/threonine-protein kinase
MGSVYVGRQRGAAGFERLIAIKRMHPHLTQDRELTLAFHEEARIASLIHHANVVNVVDVYEEGGEHLLVMEYIDGVAAASLLTSARREGKKLPRSVAIRIAIDALHGLHAAHELVGLDGRPMQVVHRDVSPQNILLGADGSVHLTDFGIARALERLVHTETGNLKGKLRYMPPEQARGQRIDRRTDIFALGIVLWEMLAGDRLYRGENDVEILQAAAAGDAMSLLESDPTTPPALDAIVMRALARKPEDRFATAAAFGEVLEIWARQAGEVASAAEVAEVVAVFAGQRIIERRTHIQDLLAGRRQVAVKSGNHPVVMLGTPTAQTAAVLGLLDEPRPRRPAVWAFVLGIVTLAAVIGAGTLFFVRSGAKQTDAARSAQPAQPARPDASDRIEVSVHADVPIDEIRGPGVTDVSFDTRGAKFFLPRSAAPVEVEVSFADGTVDRETVTPTANAAIRLRAKVGADGSAAPKPSASAKASPKVPPKPADPGPGVGGLKKNPYE